MKVNILVLLTLLSNKVLAHDIGFNHYHYEFFALLLVLFVIINLTTNVFKK